MNQKCYVNVNLMEENVIQTNGGITTNVNMSVESIMYVKKIIFGMLLPVMKLKTRKKQKLFQKILSVKQKFSMFYLPCY